MELREIRYRKKSPGEMVTSAMEIASIVLSSEGVFIALTGNYIATGDCIVMDDIPIGDARKMEDEAERGETATRDRYVTPSEDEENVYLLKNRSYFEREQQRNSRRVRYSTLITSARLEEHWNKNK
jgi:hypothetical protein